MQGGSSNNNSSSRWTADDRIRIVIESLTIIIITVLAISCIRRKLIMKNVGMIMKGMFSSTSSRPYEYSHVKYFVCHAGISIKKYHVLSVAQR